MTTALPSGRSIRTSAGIALIDCIIYMAVVSVVLGLAFGAFFKTLDHSSELERTSQATVQALHAGEQWRQDVRAARQPPRLVRTDRGEELHLPGITGEIAYAFVDGTLSRRAGTEAPWVEVLKEVRVSRFSEDRRTRVTAWRWEVELAPRRENARFQRVLTFLAVPTPAGARTVAMTAGE